MPKTLDPVNLRKARESRQLGYQAAIWRQPRREQSALQRWRIAGHHRCLGPARRGSVVQRTSSGSWCIRAWDFRCGFVPHEPAQRQRGFPPGEEKRRRGASLHSRLAPDRLNARATGFGVRPFVVGHSDRSRPGHHNLRLVRGVRTAVPDESITMISRRTTCSHRRSIASRESWESPSCSMSPLRIKPIAFREIDASNGAAASACRLVRSYELFR